MNRRPRSASARVRRTESSKYEFPPSMMMSPWSSKGTSCSMMASTAPPAFTMSMILRGGFNTAISSSMVRVPITLVPRAGPSRNSVVRAVVRL